MSIVAYGYGVDAANLVDVGEVELATSTFVVELEDMRRIIDLPDDLEITVTPADLVVAVEADLEIQLDDESFDVEAD